MIIYEPHPMFGFIFSIAVWAALVRYAPDLAGAWFTIYQAIKNH